MRVYVIHKKEWQEHTFKYSDGGEKTHTWQRSVVGEVKPSRESAHASLLAEGFQVADPTWFSSDYSRRSPITTEGWRSDEADIIEREVE
jgi:hypothetical protein